MSVEALTSWQSVVSRHTRYPLMSEPPSAVGAVQSIWSERWPGVETGEVGTPGATTTVDASTETEDEEPPNSEVASTEIEWSPGVTPVNSWLDVLASTSMQSPESMHTV